MVPTLTYTAIGSTASDVWEERGNYVMPWVSGSSESFPSYCSFTSTFVSPDEAATDDSHDYDDTLIDDKNSEVNDVWER
jgi:hypothetical protein